MSTEARQRRRPLWRQVLLLAGASILMAVLIQAFVAQAFYIPSESMEPGLVTNDRIVVEKVTLWGSADPKRGDVVVFKDPGGWLPESPERKGLGGLLARLGLVPEGGHLVKRVIGVAGDTITCCDDQGRIAVNGRPLDESGYVAEQTECNGPRPPGEQRCNWEAGPVPEGRIFVMGDNRAHSQDSSARLCGRDDCDPEAAYVPVDNVVGRVVAVVWPPGHTRFGSSD